MTGHRIIPITREEPVRQRRPRVKDALYLALVRELPCVVCGAWPVEAAHIRAGSRKHGKRETGTAEKSSDRWTLPLCNYHHREQHTISEETFWRIWEIDPFATALALWAADGDLGVMTQIVQEARR